MTVWRNRGALGPSNALVRDDRVVEYAKQPLPIGAEHIDYGMLIMTRDTFAHADANQAFDLADVLTPLASDGQLAAFVVQERFYEIGDRAALRETEEHLTAGGPPASR
jgi:NDP-sugar pyrophosphorylase family protein